MQARIQERAIATRKTGEPSPKMTEKIFFRGISFASAIAPPKNNWPPTSNCPPKTIALPKFLDPPLTCHSSCWKIPLIRLAYIEEERIFQQDKHLHITLELCVPIWMKRLQATCERFIWIGRRGAIELPPRSPDLCSG